jgi:hypothetical protein
MDAAEVSLRVRRRLEVALDDASWRLARRRWRRSWEPAGGRILRAEPSLDAPLGVLAHERVALVSRAGAESPQAIVERADASLAGRVRLLGYPEVELAEDADPERDPFTGRRWPDRHGKLIDYRAAAYGDPKWIWELNRCQELPLLCLAARLTGDDRYARAALRRLLSWLEGSRPGRGIAWSNGFEAGLRGISFALCYDALRGTELLGPGDARRILHGLWQHGRFVVRDHSFGSSANNHLVGEAAGLATIALLAPELRESEAWLRRALAWLEREAGKQILPDGSGAEQALAYHLFVLDLLLLVVALLEARALAVPAALRGALERSADALALQVAPGEPDPAYGDGDDGRAFVLDGREARNAPGIAASLASCLGHGGARRLAGTPDPASLLLFGAAGLARFESVETSAPPASGLLSDSGLVVLRRSGVRTTLDAGPLGYLTIAAHGHADALSVTVADEGAELVTDPGTGSYFGDRARRTAFRGTALHATVTVDGLDQAEQAGPFLWREHYRCTLRHLDLVRGVVVAEHDGYRRLPDPVRHRRALVALEDGSLLVYDRLDARDAHQYAQAWPLHPSLAVRTRSEHVIEAFEGERPRLLLALAPAEGAVRTLRGELDPHAGWWSRRLESVEPAWTIRHECLRSGGIELAALLVPRPRSGLSDPELRLSAAGGATQIECTVDGGGFVVGVDLDDTEAPVRIQTVDLEETAR